MELAKNRNNITLHTFWKFLSFVFASGHVTWAAKESFTIQPYSEVSELPALRTKIKIRRPRVPAPAHRPWGQGTPVIWDGQA